MGDAGDRLGTDFAGQLNRGRIRRMRQRLGQRDGAFVIAFVIVGRPFPHRHRPVFDHIGRLMAAFECGEINEGLERGTRLAHRIGGSVERAVVIGAAADHGAQRAVRRHGDKRAFFRRQRGAVLGKARRHGLFGLVLQIEVECGFDDQPFVVFAGEGRNLRHRVVNEIARTRRCLALHDLGPGRKRILFFGLGDEVRGRHRRQHQARARGRGVGRGCRIVARRRLDAAREDRGFGKRQVARRFAEEAFRGGLDAEDAGAEIDVIEIEREDFVLGVAGLEIEGEERFLRLAFQRAVGFQKKVLSELLGQRRTALHERAVRQIGQKRPRQSPGVDAEMITEAAVLDRDEGVADIGRQFADADIGALRQAAPGQQAALVIEQCDIVAGLIGQQICGVGKVVQPMGEHDAAGKERPDEGDKDGVARKAERLGRSGCGGSGGGGDLLPPRRRVPKSRSGSVKRLRAMPSALNLKG